MKFVTEQDALIGLNGIPGFGNAKIRKLVQHFGSAGRILGLPKDSYELQQVLTETEWIKFSRFDLDRFLRDESKRIEKNKIRVVTYRDECYPVNLKEISDAPVVLYQKGNLETLNPLSIAIVGSRQASYYGNAVADNFAAELAAMGITVVSGLALGIDTAAHRGCLRAKGQTVAVLGSGLDVLYPRQNEDLARRIEDNGCLLSEFPMTMPPHGYNFPRRNRIVSGLSIGVVVVEAARNSGALITGRLASEQGREVFAVPGKIDQPNTQGVHALIKEGAKLVTHVNDILEELTPRLRTIMAGEGSPVARQPTDWSERKMLPEMTDSQKKLYTCIQNEPVYIDQIIGRFPDSGPAIHQTLMELELKQLIRRLPGKYFVRTAWENQNR